MNQAAEFEIIESFNITKIGFVVLGNILSGEINLGDIIEFNIANKRHQLKITGINFASKPNVFPDRVGLSFTYNSDAEKEFYKTIKVNPQIGTITGNV